MEYRENLDPQRIRVLDSLSTEKRDRLVDPCDSACNMRSSCERGAYPIDPNDPNIRSYYFEGITCAARIWRKKLAADSGMRGRGKRHNAHASLGRKSHAQRAKELGLAQPDLMVKRHIRDGRDIKGKGAGDE